MSLWAQSQVGPEEVGKTDTSAELLCFVLVFYGSCKQHWAKQELGREGLKEGAAM